MNGKQATLMKLFLVNNNKIKHARIKLFYKLPEKYKSYLKNNKKQNLIFWYVLSAWLGVQKCKIEEMTPLGMVITQTLET